MLSLSQKCYRFLTPQVADYKEFSNQLGFQYMPEGYIKILSKKKKRQKNEFRKSPKQLGVLSQLSHVPWKDAGWIILIKIVSFLDKVS